jgi:peptidoglycan hydrolase-like protein with peptidoglycan-binding domain
MGTTGHSTGKHLHWEIWSGKKHGWTSNGKGFKDPVEFMKEFSGKESSAPAAPAPQKPTTFAAPKSKPALSEYLSKGDRNVETAWLQYVLELKVDGIFGSATRKAVISFQKKMGLRPDGVVGPVTWRRVPEDKIEVRQDGTIPKPALTSWLKQGSRGEEVRYLQQELGIKVDGFFGSATKLAVRNFQRSVRLKVDGIVGPVTYSRL